MDDVSASVRERLVEVLDLWANVEAQRACQAQAPAVSVSHDLFNLRDDWYRPAAPEFGEGFTRHELEALHGFNRELTEVAAEPPKILPSLEAFIATAHLRRLVSAARATLQRLRIREGLAP